MERQGVYIEDDDMQLIFNYTRMLPKYSINFNLDGIIVVGGVQQNAQIREQGTKVIIIEHGVIPTGEYELEVAYKQEDSCYLYLVFDFKIRRVLYFSGILCFVNK